MKILKIFCLALLCLTNVIAQSNDEALNNKIKSLEENFEKVLNVSKAAGFSVAIVKGNDIIYANGFGFSDIENKTPVTSNTIFAIGSSTKAFTASLMGLLRDQGKIDFETSPRTYIPELKFFNSEMNTQITIKDLMTHRTGLPRHSAAWKMFPTESQDEFLARIAYQEPVYDLRSKFRYNNFMYFVQGVVAERLTSNSWEYNIKENLFKPLQMENSSAKIEGLKNNKEAAVGYYFENGITTEIDYKDIGMMNPAGGINSSANDMSKWMIAWLNNGQYNGKQILPAAYVKEAMSSQMVISGRLPRDSNPGSFMANYGYGWFLSSYKGHYRADHGGNIDGFTANVAFYPADDLGIVVLSNQNRSGVPQIITNIIADQFLDIPQTDWIGKLEKLIEKQMKTEEVKPIVTAATAHSLSEYKGLYSHKGYGTYEVIVRNDSLFANFPAYTQWLNPIHPNVFETFYVLDDQVDPQSKGKSIKFVTNFEDKISGSEIKLESTLDPIAFDRRPLERKLASKNQKHSKVHPNQSDGIVTAKRK
ncbi:serine hydrolase [Lutimonas vermicola]|uniref:Serine hydrolase n=1 Tax=Lutimonas vermicola TaxID=414288 RepID=A0ABU9L2K4_9FLAO